MERPFDPSRPADVHAHSQDTDPWSEFLSESSEELQQFPSEIADGAGDADLVSASLSADAIDSFYSEEPQVLPTPSPVEGAGSVISPAAAHIHEAPPPAPLRLATVAPVAPRAETETPAGRPVKPVPRVFASPTELARSIALQEVLRRQTPLHWSEAVATVDALCAVLEPEGDNAPIPDLTDILITADGHVVIRPGAVGNRDVATLGRTLHALLATTTTPVPLRLFATSSTSSDRFKSVALYSEALSYYAAPGGHEELIRALYHRALASKVVVPPVPRDEPVAAPAVVPVAAKPIVHERPRVPAWAIAAGVGVMIGTSAAAWIWQGTPLDSSPARVVDAGRTTAPTATPAAAARDDWRLGRVSVRKSVPALRTGDTPSYQPRRSAAGSRDSEPARRPTQPIAVEAGLPLSPSSPTPSEPSQAIDVAPPSTSSIGARPTAPLAATESRPVATVGDGTIYSDADRDVRPPVMLSRQMLPPASPSDAQLDSTVELIIDSAGRVQSVKLLERPKRLPDMNILHAMKGLRFSPAIKDGQPVAYRYQLHQTAAPQ